MDKELGGFAEEPEYVSDAFTEEEQIREFEAFNYCLAEEYSSAMYAEDFESLGEVDDYLFNNICEWINYNPNLGNEALKESIQNGSLITKNNRTFLSAIAESRNMDWGELYTSRGVYSPEVIVMLIECAGAGEKVLPVYLKTKSEEELHELNLAIYSEIERRYIEEDCDKEYLLTIQRGYKILYTKKEYKSLKIPCSYRWAQDIAKKS